MRKAIDPLISIGHVRLPAALARDVKALLSDPTTGRTRYGSMSALLITLLAKWRDDQLRVDGPLPLPTAEIIPLKPESDE